MIFEDVGIHIQPTPRPGADTKPVLSPPPLLFTQSCVDITYQEAGGIRLEWCVPLEAVHFSPALKNGRTLRHSRTVLARIGAGVVHAFGVAHDGLPATYLRRIRDCHLDLVA
jgi:hypothetical protein